MSQERPLQDRVEAAAEPVETGADRRRNVRVTTVFQIARIITSRSEELCILRDVSPDGLRAEVYIPMRIDDELTIELRTGHKVAGRIVWTRDGMIGVKFHRSVPMSAMLARGLSDERRGKIRAPRIDVDLPALLCIDDQEIEVRVCNISQAGLRVVTDRMFRPHGDCVIRLDGLGGRKARIQWCRGEETGLLLVQPLTYGEFVAWRQAALGDSPRPAA